ncbi:MAG: FAD-dependent oxidoreductase [Desulfobacteraceae bacterium]|jgi:glycerol-3-phosphate dehydrogenase
MGQHACKLEHILIIGGGVGGALAHDLALRGFQVTLVEKGELLSGATGRHHGLLHSGARYVFNDIATSRECYEENITLKRIAPHAIEANGGFFIAVDEEDLSYQIQFLQNCKKADIPTRKITIKEALALEPNLNPKLKAAVIVPDGSMDAWRFALSFFATAKANGAAIHPFCQVTNILVRGNSVVGVQLKNYRNGRTEEIGADLVVNAAGAWAGQVAAMAGIYVPIQPCPGVMVSVADRLCHRVINRLHPPGEGDIIVPQRNLSILGTTAWLEDNPDQVKVPQGDVKRLMTLCDELIPGIKNMSPHAVWSACRPLLQKGKGKDNNPFEISREFDCFDHGRDDNIHGLISLIGGKATTMRAMAEQVADLICKKTGRVVSCATHKTLLLSHRRYFDFND